MKYARAIFLSTAIASMSFALASCGESDADKAAKNAGYRQAQTSASTEGSNAKVNETKTLASALADLPTEDRTTLQDRQKRLAESLSSDVARAINHSQSTDQLSFFITRQTKSIEEIKKRLPNQQQYLERAKAQSGGPPSMQASGVRNAAMQVASMLVEIDVRQAASAMAAESDPLVSEAYKRWQASNPQNQTVAEITRTLVQQPCLIAGAASGVPNPISFRNISVGMTESEAIKAVCAGGADGVRMTQRAVDTAPSDGAGNSTQTVPKRYTRQMTLCFDCVDGSGNPVPRYDMRGADAIQVDFSPSGRVIAVSRNQTFYDDNDPGIGPNAPRTRQPRKLTQLLPPLEQKFGKPSFVYNDGGSLRVGWVYLDGKTPLPQESWYFRRLDPFSGAVQFAADQRPYGTGVPTRAQLQSMNPRSTYCVQKYFQGLDHDQKKVGDLFKYGTLEQISDANKRSGWKGRPSPEDTAYNPVYDAAGLTEKCGVVVFAAFFKTEENTSRSSPFLPGDSPAVDRNVDVFSIDMKILDANTTEDIKARASAVMTAPPSIAKSSGRPDSHRRKSRPHRCRSQPALRQRPLSRRTPGPSPPAPRMAKRSPARLARRMTSKASGLA